ncbi:hypothetical protein D9758_002436 [Tetrapyrgos nigripes]|uniref:laccase n=1 Tax=Tetrapyrgos nigripes TaxID=182062 RepID=A0A8H5LT39_9AGAR|nr:hypothetical protein D9758_002436 [Tetrapyrgos nigripes]
MTRIVARLFKALKSLRTLLFTVFFVCFSYFLFSDAYLKLSLNHVHNLRVVWPFSDRNNSEAEGQKDSRFTLSPELHSYREPRTVTYDFTLEKVLVEPDGVKKEVLAVNGLFPGPTIEVRSGDELVVNVFNGLGESTSLHWHGIRHTKGSVSQDGAVGVTGCAIPPGRNQTYRFHIDDEQSGTFWYHSHYPTQRADGLYGALIIHPPFEIDIIPANDTKSKGPLPGELKLRVPTGIPMSRVYGRNSADESSRNMTKDQVILLGDWYHRSGKQVFDWYQSLRSAGKEPVPDSTLANGMQASNCTKLQALVKSIECREAAYPRIMVDAKKRNILRLVNVGSQNSLHFSVDDHLLRLVEADGTRIDPVVVKEVPIALGQRYGLELIPNAPNVKEGSVFWARYHLDMDNMPYPCVYLFSLFSIPSNLNIASDRNPLLDLQPKAILQYSSKSKSTQITPQKLPETQFWNIPESEQLDPLTLLPLEESQRVLPPAEDVVLIYVTSMTRTSTGGKPFGYVNQTTWKPNLQEPILARPSASLDEESPTELIVPIRSELESTPNSSSSSSNSTPWKNGKGKVVDIIVNNLEEDPHPFHLHSHHFWPLYTFQARIGKGSYRWDRPPSLPTTAPALRDTFLVPQRGYAVFRVLFDTPGYWLFHCHMEIHLSSGMAMIFDVMGDRISEEERKKASGTCQNI